MFGNNSFWGIYPSSLSLTLENIICVNCNGILVHMYNKLAIKYVVSINQ